MTKRSHLTKRVSTPLAPSTSVLLVSGDSLTVISSEAISIEAVGLKAFGLACLPVAWTKPFFVVSGEVAPTQAALLKALERSGLTSEKQLIVRSSGIEETIQSRGALESGECEYSMLFNQIEILRKSIERSPEVDPKSVHWVVQQLLPTKAKGHLSNESRVAENKRDWVVEVEAFAGQAIESHPISLRRWRDSQPPSNELLFCPYRENYIQCLKVVAKWAYDQLIRVHFEWVWDGFSVYIVQADGCDEHSGGIEPRDLVRSFSSPKILATSLRVFREATEADFQSYRKLANAKTYRELGYDVVPFFVLDDQDEVRRIIEDGACSEDLLSDLVILTQRALVIRSDGQNVPDELRQMLPRSEELRSAEDAKKWLLEIFGKKAVESSLKTGATLAGSSPCLIAHHFLPATAAAWSQARPDHRRVRIESLWGLPEGLYWHAYDVFDVDTQTASVTTDSPRPSKFVVRERRRYKEHFIAPDRNGNWVLHKTASGPDWQRSIKRTDWIEEIAWTSRKIAKAFGGPVVVMWFVDVPAAASPHQVMPWYHEPCQVGASPHKAAPRRKISSSTDFVLRSRLDWLQLKEKMAVEHQIVRIRVQPTEPEIVRDPKFAEELAEFAKSNKLVVELEGGILSHAYYLLSKAGCTVECANLDSYATDDFELEFNKLVRDLVPASIAERGEMVTTLRLEGAALIAALRRKLVEESMEVLDARTSDDIAEELADVREVMLALMNRLEIADADVEVRRKRKAKARGSFNEALMLVKTAVAPSMSFQELQADEGGEQNFVSASIQSEAEIPYLLEDLHVDKRVDSAGVAERQFTIELPAHASGYQVSRVPFQLPRNGGGMQEMAFEIILSRKGSDLRVRARVINAAVQLHLDFDGFGDSSADVGPARSGR